MFTEPLSLNDGVTNQAFKRIGSNGPTGSTWIYAGSTDVDEKQFYIKHQVKQTRAGNGTGTSNNLKVKGHLIQMRWKRYNATDMREETYTVNLTINHPVSAVFPDSDLKKAIAQIVGFIGVDANRQAVVLGES